LKITVRTITTSIVSLVYKLLLKKGIEMKEGGEKRAGRTDCQAGNE
jgi:hypothetical protein